MACALQTEIPLNPSVRTAIMVQVVMAVEAGAMVEAVARAVAAGGMGEGVAVVQEVGAPVVAAGAAGAVDVPRVRPGRLNPHAHVPWP